MHIMFAGAYRSTLQAQRLYLEDVPGRRVPDRKAFSSTNQHLFQIAMQLPRTNVTE
jgi:hypothetical protein